MPLYEYVCEACHAQMELLVRGDSPVECPECGAPRLAKQLSVVAAPVVGRASMAPMPQPGTCGRPQCGSFGCQGLE